MNKKSAAKFRVCKRYALILLAAVLPLHTASADLIEFSYTFEIARDGNTSTEFAYRSILEGIIDGTVQSDGDTILVNSFVSANIDGYDYVFSPDAGIRGANPADGRAFMSFSGSLLDFWVCPSGFVFGTPPDDCSFGTDGGFLVSQFAFGFPGGFAVAGPLGFGPAYRAIDPGLRAGTWTASRVSVPEPGTLSLLLMGVAGIAAARRRRTG